jgi:hypothetical protein
MNDPHLIVLAASTLAVGYLMTLSGLQKSALELRRPRRTCPSCGRRLSRGGCGCLSG